MKKNFVTVVSLFTMLFVLFMTGCTGESSSVSNTSDNAEKVTAKANAEISQTALQVWENSIGTIWAHGAIEITNNGDVPIKIGDISFSFVGEDDLILGSATLILPIPEIIQPGEKSYAGDSTTIDGAENPEQVKKLEVHIDFDETDEECQLLTVQDTNIVSPKNEYSSFKITGRVVNSSSEKADDIRIILAMFDADGNLLGIYKETVSVTLQPEDKMGFEASYPSIDIDGFEKMIDHVKGFSYNWTW